jgi:tetratricopeptide (TPR) repeat protein
LTRAYYLKAQKEAAGAFISTNEYEQADEMIARAIRLNPNSMQLRLAHAKMRALSGQPVDLKSIGKPQSDAERISYAEALLAQNNFAEAAEQMNCVIGNANGTKELFAIADLALMIKDLDSAEKAYRKAGAMPDGEKRGNRGLTLVAKARESARQDLTLAEDLARRKQLASAIDKFHSSIFSDPRRAEARDGLGQSLERLYPDSAKDLREAVNQYRAYIALSPSLPEKDKEKLEKHITKVESKAYKLDEKNKVARR